MTHQELEKITGKKKREDIQLFVVTHKKLPYDLPDNSLYTPIQVGYSEDVLSPVRDNTGDNISEKNQLYAELTAVYWIYKNYVLQNPNLKYVGHMQYRRQLMFDEHYDFDALFNKYDAIVPMPIAFTNTLKEQYENCHSKKEFPLLKQAIEENFPEYSKAYEEIMENGHIMINSNGWIMKRNDYIAYCEFLFKIGNALEDKLNVHTAREAREKAFWDIVSGERRNCNNKGEAEVPMGTVRDIMDEWARLDPDGYEEWCRNPYTLIEMNENTVEMNNYTQSGQAGQPYAEIVRQKVNGLIDKVLYQSQFVVFLEERLLFFYLSVNKYSLFLHNYTKPEPCF